MTDIQASDDAEILLKGSATFSGYGSSTSSEPYITLSGMDLEQFDYIMKNAQKNITVKCFIGIGDKLMISEEMQFKGAYDNKSGKYIKLAFQYDQDLVDTARSLVNQNVEAYIITGEFHVPSKKEKGPYGKYASQLLTSSLMQSRAFWSLVGREENYLDWLRNQKCLVSKRGVDDVTGARNEAAHVREIKYGAGMAQKPEYFAIPLHSEVHKAQHEYGVFYIWEKCGRPTPKQIQYPIYSQEHHVRQWLIITTLGYIKNWIHYELKKYFNISSLSFLSPDMMRDYLHDKCKGDSSLVNNLLDMIETPATFTFLTEK